MGKWLISLLAVLVIVIAALGAAYLFYYQPQSRALDEARGEASLCAQERSALKNRVSDLESMLEELKAESTDLESRVREKEEELAQVQSTQDELVKKLEQEIADGQIEIKSLKGQLKVDVVDEILFDSGEAELKPAGREVLQKVAGVLSGVGRPIRVQGHTDNVPIRGKLAETYPTNWELSSARAVNVVRFLQDEAGLAPELLVATALSEYHPRASNETGEGRQRNRRIEIVLEATP